MLKIYDASMKLLAVYDKLLKCADKQVLNAEYLLNFVVVCDKTKSDYLYDKANILEIDNDFFKVYSLREIHKAGALITLTIQAEHIHYKLVDEANAIENFNMTDTILNIGAKILQGTGFDFETDFTETVEIKLEGLYTRQALLIELANKCTGEIGYYRYNIRMMRSIKQNTIYAQFANNIDEISRVMDFAEDKVTYDINLLDTTNDMLTELKTVHLGDSVFVTDKELGIFNIEKKVVEIERDKLLGKTSRLILGDPKPRMIDAIKKTIKSNVLIEVVEEKVIVAETAQLMSCWIDEANIQYLETNFKALNTRETFPTGGIRHFIRIEDERYDMCYQELSQTETQDYTTKSGKQIYWTSIDDAPQAYKYFTITDPLSLNKELTEADRERFKVKVRKVLKESVKKSILFKEITLTNGSKTVTPIELLGEGVDVTGTTQRGKGFEYKEQVGPVWGGYNENNDGITAIRANLTKCQMEYWDMNKKDFTPFLNQWAGGAGNVIFYKDKTSFTDVEKKELAVGTNALHVGYSSTGGVDTGKGTSMFCSGLTLLGVECGTGLPPVTTGMIYLYNKGDRCINVTGDWNRYADYGGICEFKTECLYMHCATTNYASVCCETKNPIITTTNGFKVRVVGKVLFSRNANAYGSNYDLLKPPIYIQVNRGSATTASDLTIWTPDKNTPNYEMRNVDFDITKEYKGTRIGKIGIGCHGAYWENEGITVEIYSIQIERY